MDAFQPRTAILLQSPLRKWVSDMYGMAGSTLNGGMKRAMEHGIIEEVRIPRIYPQRAYRLRSPFIKSWSVKHGLDKSRNDEHLTEIRLLNIDYSKDRKILGLSARRMPRSTN